ncbi:MAG: hypothetical protein ACKER6_01370 [Candidatus Hodgkinia cicadicola]
MDKFKPKSSITKRFTRLSSGPLRAAVAYRQRKLSKGRKTAKQQLRLFTLAVGDGRKVRHWL